MSIDQVNPLITLPLHQCMVYFTINRMIEPIYTLPASRGQFLFIFTNQSSCTISSIMAAGVEPKVVLAIKISPMLVGGELLRHVNLFNI
ncbi:unnamed protein product [Brassica napus]|uniref:(rape) hypothetical protein n=1 Tax=Brassica napus TaxID=3708 RepID=A0A816JY44_BRANA|nr:unnamed protein product [Brassica napus]